MAQTMARKRKKPARRPSITRWLSYLTGRLCRAVMRYARKNPLLACGFTLFVLTFGFVSKNAFFNQPAIYHGVFFSTRPAAGRGAAFQPSGAHAPGHDADLEQLQRKLADLGLYEGAIDGRSGPRTREALKKWQELKQDLAQDRITVPAVAADHVGAIIRGDMASPAIGRGAKK